MALRLNLAGEVTPVTLVGENGEELAYEVREMMASVRDKYLDSLGDRMKVGPDGKVIGIKKFDGLQASLLSHCLFDKDGKQVTKEIIQTWPASVVSNLFNEAQKLNRLIANEEDGDIKNA